MNLRWKIKNRLAVWFNPEFWHPQVGTVCWEYDAWLRAQLAKENPISQFYSTSVMIGGECIIVGNYPFAFGYIKDRTNFDGSINILPAPLTRKLLWETIKQIKLRRQREKLLNKRYLGE